MVLLLLLGVALYVVGVGACWESGVRRTGVGWARVEDRAGMSVASRWEGAGPGWDPVVGLC